jgi:hypothetical protein
VLLLVDEVISAPEPTTMMSVAMTMTAAAFRTDGGSRMKRSSRRSTGFRRPMGPPFVGSGAI